MNALLVAVPLAALAGPLALHRKHLADQAKRRASLLAQAKELGEAFSLVPEAHGAGWKTAGVVLGRETQIILSTEHAVRISVRLTAVKFSAAHASQFARGGLSEDGYVQSTHSRLPHSWMFAGADEQTLDALPSGLKAWLENNSTDIIVAGELLLVRELPIMDELRALQKALRSLD